MSQAEEMVNPDADSDIDGTGELRRRNIYQTLQENFEKGSEHFLYISNFQSTILNF